MSRFVVRVAKAKTVEVSSVEAAAVAVRAEIEGPLNWMGSREWYETVARQKFGVPVMDDMGVEVARVAYNGRVEVRS